MFTNVIRQWKGDFDFVIKMEPKNFMAIFNRALKVANPQLWSPESPYLYQVKLTRYEGKKVADVQTLKTGIRTISVSKNNRQIVSS